jgi:glycosyltransferase 2 family protein
MSWSNLFWDGISGIVMAVRRRSSYGGTLNFVNKIFPSGGVSGISYFGVRLRSEDVPAGRATMVQIMRLFLQFTSFEVLLIFGLLFLAIGGHVNNMVILVASSITTLMVVGTLAFMYVVGSERRIHSTFGVLARAFNTVMRIFRPGKPDTISMDRAQRLVQEMHNSYKMLFKDWRKLRAPVLWALVINMAEVLSVYSVYVAFGAWVNLGAIILAFAVANFAGLISVLPAGAGIYEFLMTAVLTAAGIPLALSLPATVMFRVLSTTLQLIPGYYFYHKAVRDAGRAKPAAAARPG